MTDPAASPNDFERDKAGTNARSDAEAAIEELQRRGGVFVNAVRATRMPMVLTDPNLPGNPIVFANEAFLELSGYGMDEVLGQQPHFMNGRGTDPRDAARFVEVLRSEEDDIIETIQYRKDGSPFVATVLLSAYKDENGRTLNHFMSWLDVTRRAEAESEVAELKQAQAALEESEAALRASEHRRVSALIAADMGTWDYDLVADVCHFDARAQDLYNLPSDRLDHRPEGVGPVVHPDDVGPMFEEIKRASDPDGEGRYDIVYRIARADGTYRWLRAVGMTEFEGTGKDRRAVRIVGASRDITIEREAETALRESEDRLRDVLNSMTEGFALFDEDFTILEVNDETLRLDGRSRAELIGRSHWEAFPGSEDSALGELFKRVMRERTPGSLQHVYQWPNGTKIWIDVRAYPNPKGRVACFWRDISAQKAAADALRESEERNAFLVRFSDAVRGISDPALVARESCRLLSEQLGTDSTVWAVIDWDRREYVAQWAFLGDGTRVEPSRWPLDEREPFAREHLAGRPVVYEDIDSDPLIPDSARAAMRARGLLAGIAVPVMVDGRLLAVLNTSQSNAPRSWSAGEVSFVEALAGRAWDEIERARAQAALRESEEKYRTLFGSIDEGFVEMEMVMNDAGQVLDWRWLDYNSSFERMSGLKGRKGQLFSEIVPELEPEWAERYGQVIATGEALRFELPVSGLNSWFDVFVSRIGDAGSRRLAVVFNNITVRKRAEAALRESEARLSAAFESVPAGVAVIGQDGKVILANSEYLRFLPEGVIPSRDPEHGDRWKAWDEEGRPVAPENYPGARALRGERVIPGQEMLFTDEEGRPIWTNVATAPTFDNEGRVTGLVSVISDIDERKRSAEALADREERFRLIVENARDYGIFTTDPEGRIEQWYEGAAEVFGWSAEEAVGQLADITFTPEDRESGEPRKELEGASREGWVPNVRWHIRKDGQRIFIEGISSALRDASGALTGFLKIGQDVTERRRAEERQKTLLAELQHRVRNILAVIRSVVRRTKSENRSAEDYADHLEGRISALARTQVLLTRKPDAGLDLQDLIREELLAQAAAEDSISLSGPDVTLAPKAAEVLALAVHELATNATKYGAFARAGGRLAVEWTIEQRDGPDWLTLDWIESGVAVVGAAPLRQGFGAELIARRVPYELGGRGSFELRPGGLAAEIAFPLVPGESILQTHGGVA